MKMRVTSIFAVLFLAGLMLLPAAHAQSGATKPVPTPTPVVSNDDADNIYTEEVRLNFTALDAKGKFATGVTKEDLVISENGRLHQPDSLSSVPANVLIMLDTGGSEKRIKGQSANRGVASRMIGALKPDDSIALMEFNDKVNILAEWTRDRELLGDVLKKKMGFGKFSRLSEALITAIKFMERAPEENRHIVLITDGVDTATLDLKAEAIKSVLSSNVNIHVLSYTVMERRDLPVGGVWKKGDGKQSTTIPEDILITLPGPIQDTARLPRIGTVNLDKEMMRKYRKRAEELKRSEADLTQLSEDTNGEIYLPGSLDEMQDITATLARNIDSQYTLTYTPRESFGQDKSGAVRTVEVTSRRAGLVVQGKRKVIAKKP